MIEPRPRYLALEALPEHWHPIIKSIYASRIKDLREVDKHIKHLLPVNGLKDATVAAERLATAIAHKERILIYGDYDVDGASATALCVRVLKRLGANVDWFVPKRDEHGYGLTVEGLTAIKHIPQLIVTVDNGIRSHAAVAHANQLGIDVIISDHHLPDDTLPDALTIVNPNQADCAFPSKHLAGVGVAFYLLMALREQLLAQSQWPQNLRLSDYLDLVALGTVADVVPLDHNNRILVNLGLQCMRSHKANLGIRALCAVSNINAENLTAQDIAFALGPRLNAVGRLGDMSEGVAMLLSDDWMTVQEYAQLFDALNRDRKAIENSMVEEALARVDATQSVLCLYQAHWHEGVLGIVASRLKSRFSRPVMVATEHHNRRQIKASLRSIQGVALDELLAYVDAQLPENALHYGGHAMAAGLSLDKTLWPDLINHLQAGFAHLVGSHVPQSPLYIDGELPAELMQVAWAKYLERLEPWGAALPAPLFANVFELLEWRLLGSQHSRLSLREPYSGQVLQATWFFHQVDRDYKGLIEVAYELQVNRFYGDERLNLLVHSVKPFRHAD